MKKLSKRTDNVIVGAVTKPKTKGEEHCGYWLLEVVVEEETGDKKRKALWLLKGVVKKERETDKGSSEEN
ncbi:unnamed protein product [Gordionus sp. m RMFG-2023]